MTSQHTSMTTADRQFRTDHLMSDLKGRSVRGGAVTLAAQACKFVLQMGSTMVLARMLTKADFGLIYMVSAFTGFVSMFKDLGLSMATVQRAQINHAQVSTLFWINVGLSLGLTGVAAAMAPAVAWFYGEPQLVWVTIAIGGTFIFGGLSAQHSALLRRQMRFTTLATIEVAAMTAGITTAILMAWRGFGYWALVGLGAGTAVTNMLLLWYHSPWRPSLPQRGTDVKAFLAFGTGVSASNFFHHLGRNADGILIGGVLGAAPVGLYSKAHGLLTLPMRQVITPMGAVMLPALSRLADQPGRFRHAVLAALRMVAMATIPTVAILLVLADWVVLVVLGPDWREAGQLFRVLCFSAMLSPLNAVLGWILVALGKTRTMMRWSVIHNLLVVASMAVGLQWGLIGVATSFAITGVLVRMPYFYWEVSRVSPLSITDFYKTILPYIGVAGGLCAILIALRHLVGELNAFVGLPLFMVIGLATYLGILLLFPFGRRALTELIDLRRNWPSKTEASQQPG
ncbi:MAG: lipopolysaccharide biosynthesis protein [Phycisphaeraceae bacterium]